MNYLDFCPLFVGFCPLLRDKSGREIFDPFSENGTFWAIFGHFWPICANLKNYFVKKPTCPLFFSINCDKKFNKYI